MSRTRLIRPEFFSDPIMARLTVSTRLTYMGLWTLSDDDGFFELDPPQIAAELYRFESVKRRQRIVSVALDALVATGRIRVLGCGEHAVIPTIPDHRIKGGEALHTVKKRHQRRCEQPPMESSVALHSSGLRRTMENYVSVSVSESDSESDSVSTSAQARERRERAARLTAFRRQGLPVDV